MIGLPETLTRPVRVSSDTGPQVSSDWARHRPSVAPPGLQHRDAVHLRQPDVEHDGVIGLAVAEKVAFLAIEGAIDHIAGIAQGGGQLAVQIGVVLNDEQTHACLQR